MSDDKSLSNLKAKLGNMLAGESTDFQGIAQAAADIAKQEPNVVRFTTDAAMVRRLGRELVAKQETALAELVKNASHVRFETIWLPSLIAGEWS